jgi:hypothetical protein
MDDIEFRLRQFRPRRPAPLEARFVLCRSRRPFWIVVAAALAATILIAVRLDRPAKAPSEEPAERVTIAQLTTIAIERPDEFDAVLTRISRTAMPHVGEPGGALQVLAKE